ncbi:MAG: hypothetical protein AAGK37_14280 [Pseudomonadota bacterium]
MRHGLVILILLAFAGRTLAQETIIIGDVPIPTDIEIDNIGNSPIAGVWAGRWDSRRNHILIVEGPDNDGLLDVVYAVGRDQYGSSNWLRTEARFDGDILVLEDDDLAVRYSISGTGRLRGIFPSQDRFAILQRQSLSEVLAAPTGDWFEIGERDFLATDLREDGKDVALAVAVYVPPGEGPFPLALFHHGSTGTGKYPADFEWFFANDWLADLLNAHGWIVAFPQRRGRGGSDGLYDEGFSENRSQGYAQEAHLSLPGADRALIDANAALRALRERPDVSDDPILFSGMSRGGVVALMQAGDQPEDTAGVINFVGGWVNEHTGAPEINPTLFRRIGGFEGSVLSIYGEDDPLYSIGHSESNLVQIEEVGAENELHVVTVPGHNNGHWLLWRPNLWESTVSNYVRRIKSRD